MHPDHHEYFQYTTMARLDKAINTLLGIIEGVLADTIINDHEINYLKFWLDEYRLEQKHHPFNEIFPVLQNALADGKISEDERLDIMYLCDKIRSTNYYNLITADIQRLHAIVATIAADGVITEEELRGLSSWLGEHEHLRRCWPYDEVESQITRVLADQKIDEKEHCELLNFFQEFVAIGSNQAIIQPPVSTGSTVQGLCAVCPEIQFRGSLFCFTGASEKCTRKEFEACVIKHGGMATNRPSNDLDYLVIGANGNPCWAYACYGRKVEKAVELRKQGCRLLLVHEYDFHDALSDLEAR